MAQTIAVSMVLAKETPGALQYKEVGGDGVVIQQVGAFIGTLYLRKSGLGGAQPKAITVEVHYED